MTPEIPTLDPALLTRLEAMAVEFAQLGGAEIRAALGSLLRVNYKGVDEATQRVTDPVSEVDGRVEALIRERLAEHFPEHDVIGEEIDHRPRLGQDFLWAIDPIDGTANFINGFPLFASSVGVLYRGQPIVGAVWCSTSHLLEPGVFHAAATGGAVRFNGAPLESRANPDIRRRLGGEPHATKDPLRGWDGRKTGSAAIECAFVAAGVLEMAWFERPNVWDVAGGLALARAADLNLVERQGETWAPFDGFSRGELEPGRWSAPIALGQDAAVRRFIETHTQG